MRRDDPEYKAYRRAMQRECQRKRRALAKEQGLCSICCKNPPEPGHMTCKPCRIQVTAANYRRAHG